MKTQEFVRRLLVLSLLTVLLLTSCTRHSVVWPQLLEAEKLLDTELATAAALIDSLDASQLRGEDAALYAILKTQADYKCYLPLNSDSLPRLATDYYGTPYRKNNRAAMAWYSLGCYYTELKDDPAAINAYLKAKECFPDTTIRYYALAEQNLGRHYLNRNMLTEALMEFDACKSNLISLSDSLIVPTIEYEQSLCFLYAQNYSKADSLLKELCDNPIARRNATLSEKCTYQLAKIAFHRDSLELSRHYLNRCLTMTSHPEYLGAVYNMQGDIALKQGDLEQAYYYYQRSLSCVSEINTCCTNYKHLAELSSLLGRTDSIPFYITQHDLLLDSIYTLTNQQSIQAVVARHAVEMSEWKEKTIRVRHTILSISIFLFLLFVATYWFSIYRFQQREKYMKRINQLQDRIHILNDSLAEQQNQCDYDLPFIADEKNTLSAEYETDEMLCQLIETSVMLFIEKYETIHHFLLNFPPCSVLSGDERKQILKAFSPAFAEAITVLQRSYPTVIKEELQSALCSRLGYRSKLISDLLSVSPSGLRSRKLRLKSKIAPALFTYFYPMPE